MNQFPFWGEMLPLFFGVIFLALCFLVVLAFRAFATRERKDVGVELARFRMEVSADLAKLRSEMAHLREELERLKKEIDSQSTSIRSMNQ